MNAAALFAELERLAAGEHPRPHDVLGPHRVDGTVTIRAFRPGASEVAALVAESADPVPLEKTHPAGVFAGVVPDAPAAPRYVVQATHPDGAVERGADPYAFAPTVAAEDLRRLAEGRHERAQDVLGAHVRDLEGVGGVAFAVWAPAARAVGVAGVFNGWDRRRGAMRELGGSGMWELFVPGARAGDRYRYELLTEAGERLRKADPYAFAAERAPGTASIVHRLAHEWTDAAWLERRRASAPHREPISIYEVHLGSWRPRTDPTTTYRAAADDLAAYALEMGFTHVELLPVMAHPFRGSLGYQVTGYFAAEAQWGSPDGLRALIDRLHAHGLGVILDWVPAHFPRDEFALARFDGTALYEHDDPRRSAHPEWGTLIFDYARGPVRSFLLSSALFWLREAHADGLRFDAVASMLYLDYARDAGEWTPNRLGGPEDLDAAAFLAELTDRLAAAEPGTVAMAEDSRGWPGVTHPTARGGLGFDFKWNMGWMHDTLRYFARDPADRRHHHRDLTFALTYAFSERFVLALSHDEVVDGRGSLYQKMAGAPAEKLANLRCLYAYMWAHPGKKLLFMGGEIAQEDEWWHERSLDWGLLERPGHAGVQALVRDLNHAYRAEPALWSHDADPAGFQWLDPDDADASTYAFVRLAGDGHRPVVCVANLAAAPHAAYRVGLPCPGRWRVTIDTDAPRYGGSGEINVAAIAAEPGAWQGQPFSARLPLAALSVNWLAPERG